MSWNNTHTEEVHHVNTSHPYNSAGSFLEYFEGLTYEHVNFIFSDASHSQVLQICLVLCSKLLNLICSLLLNFWIGSFFVVTLFSVQIYRTSSSSQLMIILFFFCFSWPSFCNRHSPPLVDIVLFGFSLLGFPLKVFKMRLLGRGFHTLIKGVLFSSPTDVGSHNPPPFEAQRSCWHLFPSPIDVGPLNPPPFGPSVLVGTPPHVHPLRGSAFGFSLQGFKTSLLGRSFHTLINDVLFFSPTDVGSHTFWVESSFELKVVFLSL